MTSVPPTSSQADGGGAAQTSAAPRMADQVNSLQHFQQHSRLHFIGQWKTKMNEELRGWFAEHPEWSHGRLATQSLFIHADMDAFFCSVQLAKKENEHLRGLPVGIAAGRFNSDISSCNYIARAHGITAGMYVNAARELCPDLVILNYDLPACEQVTKTLYRLIFEAFSSGDHGVRISMEVYSIDEVMIAADTGDYEALRGLCERVRGELVQSTGCTASCGIGPNIMLARLATQKAKPNGVCVLRREEVPEVMRTLPFREIHGAGRSTRLKVGLLLQEKGVLGSAPGNAAAAMSAASGPNKVEQKEKEKEDVDENSGDDSSEFDAESEGETEKGGLGGGSSERVLCSHVQRLKCEDLQKALGKKAGETFFHLCRGDDSRVAMRTGDPDDQRAMGKTLPASVGCSMNYAVRPQHVTDVWSIVRQLLDEVCAKLQRVDVTALGLRVTLLERHPYHPKETQKFMGRGRCVEVHVPVRLPHALDGYAAALMLVEVQRVVAPLLVTSRSTTDDERAAQLGLEGCALDSQVIWTVTLAKLESILVEDIRGMTIQATGLRGKDGSAEGDAATGAQLRKRAREAESAAGQLTLAAAFSKGAARRTETVDSAPDEVRRQTNAVTLDVDVDSSDGEGRDTAEAVVVLSVADSDPTAEVQQAAPSLFALSRMRWGEAFATGWRVGCAEACAQCDIPLVKAYLRCALLAMGQLDGEASGSLGSRLLSPKDELARMCAFVKAQLGGAEVEFC